VRCQCTPHRRALFGKGWEGLTALVKLVVGGGYNQPIQPVAAYCSIVQCYGKNMGHAMIDLSWVPCSPGAP